MKKMRVVFGVVLACVLAVACLAFTACGDNTFNIDTSKQATDAELKTFTEGMQSGLSDATDLPEGSFKVVFEMSGATDKVNTSAKFDGVVNLGETTTAKINGNMKEDKTETKMEVTLLADTMYLMMEAEGSTVKMKIPMSYFGIGDLLMANEVYAESSATDDETMTVEEFLASVKITFKQFGMNFSPELYIKDGVMKIVLNSESYIGLAFDKDWKMSAFDLKLDKIDISKIAGSLPGASALTGEMKINVTLRSTSKQTVTAPADADKYLDMTGGLQNA